MKKLLLSAFTVVLFTISVHAQNPTPPVIISRDEATMKIMIAKEQKNVTFKQIADSIGREEVWTASALLGQNTMSADEAAKTCKLLGLGKDVERAIQEYAVRGTTQVMPPTDPLVYRFYEIVMIYGPSLKAVIQENFGEGIMSAIDYSMKVEKIPNPNGDRVRVTMEGKFLPYKKW